MRGIVFARQQEAGKIHTLTACVGLDGALVFDEDDCREGRGCEMDDTLAVHAWHKPAVLHQLVLAFDGISDTCGEHPDERLLCALQAMADLGHWQSLDEIEAWLLERDIPFTKQCWSKME